MQKYNKFIEESSIKDTTLEVKETEQNNSGINKTYLPLDSKINSNELILIFRNQLSNDISLSIDKAKITTIGDIINLLLEKLKVSKSESIIKLFFKGRPLKDDERINDISK
jgi:hypothetical protein